MRIQTVLKTIMKKNKTSQVNLAKLADSKQSSVSTAIGRGASLENYIKFFDALGFEICIRPKHRATLSEDYYVLSAEDEVVIPEQKVGWYAPAK